MEVRFAHFTMSGKILILVQSDVTYYIALSSVTNIKTIQRDTLKTLKVNEDGILKKYSSNPQTRKKKQKKKNQRKITENI